MKKSNSKNKALNKWIRAIKYISKLVKENPNNHDVFCTVTYEDKTEG